MQIIKLKMAMLEKSGFCSDCLLIHILRLPIEELLDKIPEERNLIGKDN